MNYREMLDEFKKQKQFELLTLMVADEVDCVVQNIYSEEDFNTICCIVENAYLKSDACSINQIALAVDIILNLEGNTIEELKQMSKWDILDKAVDL